MQFWTIIADRSQCKIYESSGYIGALRFVESYEHPQARLREQDLETDKPGRSDHNDRFSRSELSPRQSAREHLADRFAKQLADRLVRGLREKSYDALRIAAEPGFLGKLRGMLPEEISRRIVVSINKELSNIPERELPEHFDRAQGNM